MTSIALTKLREVEIDALRVDRIEEKSDGLNINGLRVVNDKTIVDNDDLPTISIAASATKLSINEIDNDGDDIIINGWVFSGNAPTGPIDQQDISVNNIYPHTIDSVNLRGKAIVHNNIHFTDNQSTIIDTFDDLLLFKGINSMRFDTMNSIVFQTDNSGPRVYDGGYVAGQTRLLIDNTNVTSFLPVLTDVINPRSGSNVTISGITLGSGIITGSIVTDLIEENTPNNGVAIDGVVLKDGGITGATLNVGTILGSTIEVAGSQFYGPNNLYVPANLSIGGTFKIDEILELTTGVGITMEGITLKNSYLLGVVGANINGVNCNAINGLSSGVVLEGVTFNGTNANFNGGDIICDLIDVIGSVQTDMIFEKTPDAGITIDTVLIKDNEITCDTLHVDTLDFGGTIAYDTLNIDTINERTTDAGVIIEGTLIKDNVITCDKIICPDVFGDNIKQSCLVATTGPIVLGAEQTIDNVGVVSGDRVLVKDQGNKTTNGIWVCSTGAWTRASDADTSADLECIRFAVCQGDTHNDSLWLQTTDNVNLGVSDLVFIDLTGSGIDHNTLSSLQGGTAAEYYHLTLSEHTELTQWLDNVALGTDGSITMEAGASLTLNAVSADTLLYANGTKVVSSGSLSTNLTLTTGTLDTIQDIQTTSNPTFGNLNLDGNLYVDSIDERTGSAGITVVSELKVNGGLQDINVTSTIALGDASNTGLAIDSIATSILGGINENRGLFTAMGDPSGFPNQTDQTTTFVNGSRIFSIFPTGGSYDFYIRGKKFTKSGTDTVTIDVTEGPSIIYFDSAGVLQKNHSPTSAEIQDVFKYGVMIAFIYWDATNSQQIYFSGDNEFHGINMGGATHVYLHLSFGTRFISGLGLTGFTIGNGDLPSHAQMGTDSGTMLDEDIPLNLSAVASTVGLPCYYILGSTPNHYWRRTINATFPIITTGTGRIAYNELSGSTWQLTEVGNNNFALIHIFATNDSTYSFISVLGQGTYGTLNSAQENALLEISTINTENLIFEEAIAIGTVIFQTSNGYANGVKAKIVLNSEGENFVDWRQSSAAYVSSTPTDHGNLTNLTLSDHHSQYCLLSGRLNDILKIDEIQEFTTDNGVDIDQTRIKDKTIYLDLNNLNLMITENSGNLEIRVAAGKSIQFYVGSSLAGSFE